MDDFYLKCPYCDSGSLTQSQEDIQVCEACGHDFDVREAVRSGQDFEISEGRFVSALRIAVRHGWHEEIVSLHERGFDIDRIDYDGKTSLKYAVDHIGLDNLEIYVNTAILLAESGADVNICDNQDNCPLHSAVRFACLPVVNSLIVHGADVNAVGEEGMTPLHYCGEPAEYLFSELHVDGLFLDDSDFWSRIEQRQEDIALLLLSSGANPNIQQTHGWTPLSRIAYLGGNAAIARMLVGHGADKNHRAESGFSPLGYARSKEAVSPAHAILARTLADLGAKDSRPGMCFVATAIYGDDECAPVLALRWYRDHVLIKKRLGPAIIRIYYSVGPKIAKIFSRMPAWRILFKYPLDLIVAKILRKHSLHFGGDENGKV